MKDPKQKSGATTLVIYGLLFTLAFQRCSPNVASVDKALLRNGATSNQQLAAAPASPTSVANTRDSSAIVYQSNDQNSEAELDQLKNTGETELVVEHSNDLSPSNAWIEFGNTNKCALHIISSGEDRWKVSFSDEQGCSDGDPQLEHAGHITIEFRPKHAQ